MSCSKWVSGLLSASLLGLSAASATGADLKISVKGLPYDQEAEISVSAQGGVGATLGIPSSVPIHLKNLKKGRVRVSAEPVEYKGIIYTVEEPNAELWATATGKIRKAGKRLADNEHSLVYSTSEPPSHARLFAGLDQGILWNCDAAIPNSCGDFDNAGKGKDLTHVAYGGGYVWTALKDGGGTDDSRLWRCSSTTANACATWDLWPKDPVVITGIAYGEGRIFVSWYRAGIGSGNSGIKSCDATRSSPQCLDLFLGEEGSDTRSVVYSDGVVYAIQSWESVGGYPFDSIFALKADATVTTTTGFRWVYFRSLDGSTLPANYVNILTTDDAGYVYAGFSTDGKIAKMRRSTSSGAQYFYVDVEGLTALSGCSGNKCESIDHLAVMDDWVYVAAGDTINRCTFSNDVCKSTNWGLTPSGGDVLGLAAGESRVYALFSSGRMYACDADLPQAACSLFNKASVSINDIIFVKYPGE